MKTAINNAIYAAALSSSPAFAHAGHDHGHWSSQILHGLFFLSLAAVGAACVFAGYKAFSRKKRQLNRA
ncbi:conserved exported hypothetical protein [Alteromonas sp. 38]|uniref:hypothetical protein n=1 Tax=Alteromonas TaxID=226 RepID=UPI0012F1D5BB|nr:MULTISPECIES: hypothetical protein [Alteromonas]CAD5292204.1 conserved exported hypothetical protein [Alteromonas sp. 154]VXB16934.1 conserved exported hypothetical protein [Alteromonas sp. 38]